MVRPERIELEPSCGRERSGSPQAECRVEKGNGAPGENRTPNLMVRSHALYPIELRAHPAELRLRIITETKSFRPTGSFDYASDSRRIPRWLWKSVALS